LAYGEIRTAERVAGILNDIGIDRLVTDIGKTGVVGLLHGKNGDGGRIVAARAELDALPMVEINDHLDYKSTVDGKMHACGHDGHMAMLLGAAEYLADRRDQFDGTIMFIFQPAEEGGAGAKAMIDDGLFDIADPACVYGLHNAPHLPLGDIGVNRGPMCAAVDRLFMTVSGKGGHAAYPHTCHDPIVAASAIVTHVQSMVSRRVNPLDNAVVSITRMDGGTTDNVIPDQVIMEGTVRTLDADVREMITGQLPEMLDHIVSAHQCRVDLEIHRGYPVTVNTEREADMITALATELFGQDRVQIVDPSMGADDFAYLCREKTGCYFFLGQGDADHTAGLHQTSYNFNDKILPIGLNFWVELFKRELPA
jgi:hippurate hydrolase